MANSTTHQNYETHYLMHIPQLRTNFNLFSQKKKKNQFQIKSCQL